MFLTPRILALCLRSAFPWLLSVMIISFTVGLYLSLVQSPEDYVQGNISRIMYIHVPSAWISLGAYVLVAASSFGTLIWRNVIAGVLARAIALVGSVFTVVCLITGSIWGHGTWGTWWVWDARLTSMLFLLFLYIGYLSLWNFFDSEARAEKSASIFAIFSVINIPIIKFSVNVWSTLHQPASIIRKNGVAIDISMLLPLLIMFIALSSLFILMVLMRAQTLVNFRKLANLNHLSKKF